MKFASMLLLAGLLILSSAPAQTAASGNGDTEKNVEVQRAEAEALPFLRVTAVIADHLRHRSLNNYLGLYVSAQNWQAARTDRRVGPFLQVKYAKPKAGRSVACLFSSDWDIALCAYFDGDAPFGVATIKIGVSGHIDPYRVASSYEGVSTKLLKKSDQNLEFLPIEASTDDGRMLPAFELRKQ